MTLLALRVRPISWMPAESYRRTHSPVRSDWHYRDCIIGRAVRLASKHRVVRNEQEFVSAIQAGVRRDAAERPLCVDIAEHAGGRIKMIGGNHAVISAWHIADGIDAATDFIYLEVVRVVGGGLF
jgi:hypothetical protein